MIQIGVVRTDWLFPLMASWKVMMPDPAFSNYALGAYKLREERTALLRANAFSRMSVRCESPYRIPID